MSDQERNGGVSQQRSGHAAKDHFGRPGMAIGTDDNEIAGVTFRIGQDHSGDWLAGRLHLFDDHLGSVTNEIASHVRARLLAVPGIFLGIDHEDGNGLRTDNKRKRVRYRTPRLAARIPGDNDMLGGGPRPGLRQQEEWHAGSEEERFGRPVAQQAKGARPPTITRSVCSEFSAALSWKSSWWRKRNSKLMSSRMHATEKLRFAASIAAASLACWPAMTCRTASRPGQGFRGTTSKHRRHHENPDKVGAVNERHLGCVRGSHLAGRRGIDKNSYTLKRH